MVRKNTKPQRDHVVAVMIGNGRTTKPNLSVATGRPIDGSHQPGNVVIQLGLHKACHVVLRSVLPTDKLFHREPQQQHVRLRSQNEATP